MVLGTPRRASYDFAFLGLRERRWCKGGGMIRSAGSPPPTGSERPRLLSGRDRTPSGPLGDG